MGDSLQKVINIIESRSVKEKLRLQIIEPITPNYIFDNQSLFRHIYSFMDNGEYQFYQGISKNVEVLPWNRSSASGYCKIYFKTNHVGRLPHGLV